ELLVVLYELPAVVLGAQVAGETLELGAVGDAAGALEACARAVGEDLVDAPDHLHEHRGIQAGAVGAGGEDAAERLTVVAAEVGDRLAALPQPGVDLADRHP